jgi:hypothetical protein
VIRYNRTTRRYKATGQTAEGFADWAQTCVASTYPKEDVIAWFWRHEKNRSIEELWALFRDVHWCPKDKGGVRP